MPGVRTNTAFYRRGIPNTFTDFELFAVANVLLWRGVKVLLK